MLAVGEFALKADCPDATVTQQIRAIFTKRASRFGEVFACKLRKRSLQLIIRYPVRVVTFLTECGLRMPTVQAKTRSMLDDAVAVSGELRRVLLRSKQLTGSSNEM